MNYNRVWMRNGKLPTHWEISLMSWVELDKFTTHYEFVTTTDLYEDAIRIQRMIDPAGNCSRIVTVYP